MKTVSILGSSSRIEDSGELLGESLGVMLAALDEALYAYLRTGRKGVPRSCVAV